MSWTKSSNKLRPFPAFDTRSHVELTRISAEIMRSQTSFRRLVEHKRKEKTCTCLINIAHPLRVKWDLLIMFLAIYNCFSIPFMVSFLPSNSSYILLGMDSTIDFMFFLDLIFNFRTSYINLKTGEEITNGWLIAKNYLAGKFWIDLLATIPFDTFGLILGASSNELQLFSLLKLIRILRLNKIILYMRTKEDVKLALKFLQFILLLLMYLHLVACSWYVLVFQEKEWTPPITGIPDFYSSSVWHQYAFSLYSSVAMLVGIEIMPQTFEEIVYCSIVILTGAVITAVLFGEMAVIMANINRASTRFNDIMNHVNTTMKNLKLPQEIQYLISDYLVSTQTTLAQQEQYKKFKDEIPPSLQAEVNNKLFEKVLYNTTVFSENSGMTHEIIKKSDNLFFKPDEDIVLQNSESDSMYFLLIGKLQVIVQDLYGKFNTVRALQSGDFFGEIGVLFGCARTATVRVVEYATVAQILTEDFQNITERYPEAVEKLKLNTVRSYHDNLTKGKDKLMRRIPFIRFVTEMQYVHLLYSLRLQTYQKDMVLQKQGTLCSKILFLIDGSLDIHFSMVLGERSKNILNIQDSEGSESVPVFVCQFNAESILCAKQALIKAPVPIQITASSFAKVFELHNTDIEKIAYNIDGNLKANISILRSKHSEAGVEEMSTRAPIIDGRQIFTSAREKRAFKHRMRSKHCVLKLIMKARQRKKAGTFCFYTVVKKLIDIAREKSLNWRELRERIDDGLFPTEIIDIAQILKDSKNPVINQMGLMAQDSQNFVWRMENKLRGINYILQDLNQDNVSTEQDIEACEAMTARLSQLINR